MRFSRKQRKATMSKKMMLLALAVVSAAAFALPAGASAQEIHLTNVSSFSGTFDTSTLTAQEEPVVTCGETSPTNAPNHVTGTVSAGGTTGNITLDFTACHLGIPIIGTIPCHTTGAPLNNTIKLSGVFHLITFSAKPAILVTPVAFTIECGNLTPINVAGNVIGTITSPACGVASNNMTIKFSATGATQEDKTYTGVNYNLTFQTGTGMVREAGLALESTTTSPSAGTLECT